MLHDSSYGNLFITEWQNALNAHKFFKNMLGKFSLRYILHASFPYLTGCSIL